MGKKDDSTPAASYRVQRRMRYLREVPEYEFRAAVLDYLLDGDKSGLSAIRDRLKAIKADIPKS